MTQAVQRTAPDEMTPWVPDDSSFGARLALIRQRMGWGNVKEAALACGLPVESWRTWERDNVHPRNVVDIAEKIAQRTGCDYGWLLAGGRLRARHTTWRYREMTAKAAQPVDRPPTRRTSSGPRRSGGSVSTGRPVRLRP